jgi:CRP/FNR family cyclic AMP-dependent transcriptional regulator
MEPPVNNFDLEWFIQQCHLRRYGARQVLIRPGEAADTVFYIVKGSVSVSVEDSNGHEIVLAYLNKGDFFGEIGVFLGEMPRSVAVRTREACVCAEIGRARFEHLLTEQATTPAAWILLRMGQQLARRLLRTNRQLSDLAFIDVNGRVARVLLDLCRQPEAAPHPQGTQLRITRQEIGRLAGCSREMAGRVLKALVEQGSISARGKTIVVRAPAPEPAKR